METKVPPASLVSSVRQAFWSLDHDVILIAYDLGGGTFSLDEALGTAVSDKPKFAAAGFGACAALGFALSIAGLFSVMTYIVSLQTHDVGVRLALGAPRAAILQMMLKKGMVLIGVGLVIGLLASMVATRFLAGQLHGVSASDPVTFLLVIPAVILAGLAACFLPARRATQVDPMTTLRNE